MREGSRTWAQAAQVGDAGALVREQMGHVVWWSCESVGGGRWVFCLVVRALDAADGDGVARLPRLGEWCVDVESFSTLHVVSLSFSNSDSLAVDSSSCLMGGGSVGRD